jgi:hypothetical protein
MVTRLPDDAPVDRHETVVTHEVQDPAPGTAVPPVAPTTSAYGERVTVDYAGERRASLTKASQIIGFITGVIVALIGIRVVLRLIAANPDNGFAQFIYLVTAPFVAPFATLVATPAASGMALEISSLVAMLIYALLGWALIKLVWLLFWRPSTREASTRVYHRD